jgi:hypothetical protein
LTGPRRCGRSTLRTETTPRQRGAGVLRLRSFTKRGDAVEPSPSSAAVAPPLSSAFAGFRFPAEVIVVAVRRYLRFNLSHRDVEELALLAIQGSKIGGRPRPSAPSLASWPVPRQSSRIVHKLLISSPVRRGVVLVDQPR